MQRLLTTAFLMALFCANQAITAHPDKPIRVAMGCPAGGTVGAQDVMKAPADGYTLMLANSAQAMREQRRRVGLIFHSFNLFPHLSVGRSG